MIQSIKLIPDTGNYISLQLHKERKPYTVEEILSVTHKVYEDVRYEFELDCDDKVNDAFVYINGENVDAIYLNGRFTFPKATNYGIFGGILGFVQISIRILGEGDAEEWYYSEYASVLVKATKRSRNLDAMLKYIYENQDDILMKNSSLLGSGDDMKESHSDFWAQILLLEEIVNVYESSYGYFKANSRHKLERVESVEQVEKLQYIEAKTIQYMTQHPEFLKKEITGIRYGKQTFLPDKTLVLHNKMTQDIYENQVVVSFLQKVVWDTSSLVKHIKEFLALLEVEKKEENDYIVSSYLLYMNAVDTLKGFLKRIDIVETKLKTLLVSYERILNVTSIDCSKQPSPTAIFLSVPQYNKVYMCILKWFKKVGYELERERVMLDFINAPSVYEAYVLIKLVNQIKSLGFTLVDSQKVVYPKNGNWLYQNKEYNNTYYFANEEQSVVLYYEPIIYDMDMQWVNNISLYRNNTTSLSRDNDEERRGHYYVPDYVIKAELNGEERYIICDAKYSRVEKVRSKLAPDIAYKYIFSISPSKDNAQIIGVDIFYGITEDASSTVSFYDKEFGKKIKPFMNMIPFSEDVSVECQESNILQVIQDILGN